MPLRLLALWRAVALTQADVRVYPDERVEFGVLASGASASAADFADIIARVGFDRQ